MIINATKGQFTTGGLKYDYSTGVKESHQNPRRIAGTAPGRTWQERAARMDRDIRQYLKDHPRKPRSDAKPRKDGKPRKDLGTHAVVRLAVSAAPTDAPMDDAQWAKIAYDVVNQYTKGKAYGYDWEAVRHGDNHIHITMSRLNDQGKLLTESQDYRRCQRIGRDLEQRYNLTPTSSRRKQRKATADEKAAALATAQREVEAKYAEKIGEVKKQIREQEGYIEVYSKQIDAARQSHKKRLQKNPLKRITKERTFRPSVIITDEMNGVRGKVKELTAEVETLKRQKQRELPTTTDDMTLARPPRRRPGIGTEVNWEAETLPESKKIYGTKDWEAVTESPITTEYDTLGEYGQSLQQAKDDVKNNESEALKQRINEVSMSYTFGSSLDDEPEPMTSAEVPVPKPEPIFWEHQSHIQGI